MEEQKEPKEEKLQSMKDIEALKQGFTNIKGKFTCLICGQQYEEGQIYQEGERLLEAKKAARMHVETAHGGMLAFFLQLHSDLLGITDIQRKILTYMAQGLTDKEIAEKQKIAISTMRNHRYKLREKEKQARLYLAMCGLLHEKGQEAFLQPHLSATMRDDRYCITETEKNKIIATFFDENGGLKEMPAKEKKKLVVLRVIASNFLPDHRYSEQEVNRIIERIYRDYSYVRRLLIEYGFLDRTKSGTEYWVQY